MTAEQLCCTCCWWSTGFNDLHGKGYCYSEGDYTDAESKCDFWQASLRDEPLNDPPMKKEDEPCGTS